MSAFIVTREHVCAVVRFATASREGRDALSWSGFHNEPGQLAGLLYAENVRSVNHRYPGDTPEEPETFTDAEVSSARRLTPVQAIKACSCLEYQSCETDDWAETRAYRALRSIREHAIGQLEGYAAAPWEIGAGVPA